MLVKNFEHPTKNKKREKKKKTFLTQNLKCRDTIRGGPRNSQASKHYIGLIKISRSEMIELCIFYKQHEHRLIIRDVHTNEYQVV